MDRCKAKCIEFAWCLAAEVVLRDIWPTPECALVTDWNAYVVESTNTFQNNEWGGTQSIDGENYQTYCNGGSTPCGSSNIFGGGNLNSRDGYHCYLKTAFAPDPPDSVTINGKQLYQDSDGWILLLAYKRVAGENSELVSGTPPTSPTEGYSHIWLNDLGLSASDVESVRFYCTSSSHSRVMHFSTNKDWIKSTIMTGSTSGNLLSYWTSSTTKFSDHTAFLPDNSDTAGSNAGGSDQSLFTEPFFKQSSYLWNIRAWGTARWECDDCCGSQFSTHHQIWFKRKSSGNR
jgi:hypothetical protein